jgi:hypothetical protein
VDRMTIVGTDGKDKYITEGVDVQDVMPEGEIEHDSCLPGHHEFLNVTDEDYSACTLCGWTLQALRTKGERVVH